jgi:hypothetical protein
VTRAVTSVYGVGPEAIGPVGEVHVFEVCARWMFGHLEPGPADQPLDLHGRLAGLKRLAGGGGERAEDRPKRERRHGR